MNKFKCVYKDHDGQCEPDGRKCVGKRCEVWNDCECCENRDGCDRGECKQCRKLTQ